MTGPRAVVAADRAQANLIGFAVAAIVVTTVAVGGVAIANDAVADADRRPFATHAAERLSAHLVAGDAPHTRGPSVLRARATANLTPAALDAAVPSLRNRSFRVALGTETLAARGRLSDPVASRPADRRTARISRRVRTERAVHRTNRIDLADRHETVLADHTGQMTVTVDSAHGQSVVTLRAGGRTVLHDPGGLDGRYVTSVPQTRPLDIAFTTRGRPVTDGATATVTWTEPTARTESLVVVVGD
ncbi:MAG: hypothetical protein ABEI27_00175 [Halobellus sp.]|uniref:DUF7263 family protein n=1 Tax=Halobellus sp. TaxID=1979212 RepID=UPI0035D3E062